MIGPFDRLRRNLRQLRAALAPMRRRGRSPAAALLWLLPAAVLLRGWRALAQRVHTGPSNVWLNGRRFAAFQDGLPPAAGMRWYVIVMPYTLHFLLPCLALLHGRVPLVLVANGAKRWERELLHQRLPALPMFVLRTLPSSSLSHGDALSLLLEHQRGDFGIVDHDAYVFDAALLERLRPAASECMVSAFRQHGLATGLDYPLTHLLGFSAESLRRLMHRYRIDARARRRAPARLAATLARAGMGPRTYLKDYQDFHDTLHLLLGVALAEGLRLRFEPQDTVLHVGGTSIGSHHTKNLYALHIHLRFLELLDDPLLHRRYAFLTAPLRSAAEALQRRAPADPGWSNLPVVDELMQRLKAAGAGHGFRVAAASAT